MQWQPIETAPLNEYVLLWLDGFHCIAYQFAPGKFTEHHERKRHEVVQATHWMPLPAPPTLSESRKMGRPISADQALVQLSIRLTPSEIVRVEAIADILGVSRNEALRLALNLGMDGWKGQRPRLPPTVAK